MDAAILFPWMPALAASAGMAVFFILWRKERARLRGESGNGLKPDSGYLDLILDNLNDVVWLYDMESQKMIYMANSIESERGWKASDFVGKSIYEIARFFTADSAQVLLQRFEKQFSAGWPLQLTVFEIDVPLAGGGMLPVEIECKTINGPGGKPTLLLGIGRDISARRRHDEQLREAEERVRLALQCSGDGVWDVNLQTGKMIFLEGRENVLGYRDAEAALDFEAYKHLIHSDDIAKFQAELDRHINGEAPSFQCEFRIRTKDGGWRWFLSRGMLCPQGVDKKPFRLIGTHTDITSRKVAEVAMSRANVKLHSQIDEIRMLQTQLAEQAVRDPLTGLYNRRYLDETLEREVARARREGHPLSVVMLDVDHFKKLNDAYGHQAGDEVLKALADLLRENTRVEDVPCRWGGEEFLVLLPSMPLEKAKERAEHWRSQLEQHVFGFGNFSLSVTASFGVSGYPHQGKTPDDLTRAADVALYNAKRNGRNRVEMYEEAPIVFVTGTPQATS